MGIEVVSGEVKSQPLNNNFSYLDSKLDQVNGGPLGSLGSVSELNQKYPNGANGFFIIDGNMYFWEDNKWVDKGVYQARENADDSIEYKKIQKIGQNYDVVYTNGLPNIDTKNKTITIPKGAFYLYGRDYQQTIKDAVISLSGKQHTYITFDFVKSIFLTYSVFDDYKLNSKKDELFVGVVSFKGSESSELLNVFIKGDYLEDGILASRMNYNYSWDGRTNITDGSIPYTKNQILNSNIQIVYTNGLPNIDIENRKIIIPKETFFNMGRMMKQLKNSVEIDITSTHTYVFINFETLEIKKYTASADFPKISEKETHLYTISFESTALSKLRNVDLKGDYLVNGLLSSRFEPSDNTPNVEKTLFTEVMPIDNYIPINDIQDFSAENHYVDLITETEIYSKYDAAVSNGWGTKTLLGNDSSDTHPIYKYEFKPTMVPTEKYKKHFPKIIITTCTHGEEKMGAISLANFIKDVSDNYESNDLLRFVKNNVHLIIIPILNSYGFKNFKRKNANGVDINRNSSYRWSTSTSSDPTSIQYKGTTPFSEKENQYVRDLILENKDATAFFDYHMNGTSGDDGDYIHNFWHYIEDRKNDKGFEELNELSIRNIMLMTERSHKDYGIDKNSGFVGMINYNNKDSSLAAYAYSEGIPGFTIECLKKLQGENVVYSKNAIKISTEFIGNHILNVCRSFVGV